MATVTHTEAALDDFPYPGRQIIWTPLTSSNAVGDAVRCPQLRDKSVQFVGTFGSATCILQGSNDNSNWVTLQDVEGNAISMTATGLVQVLESCAWIRPSTSGGGGTQSVSCYVVGATSKV